MSLKFVLNLFLLAPILCFAHELQDVKTCNSFLKRVMQEKTASKTFPLKESVYPNFTKNPAFSKNMRKVMSPYLLPMNHRKKAVLDKIFSRQGVIENDKTIRKAGFTILFSQKRSFIRVLKHPRLKGYLLKVYPNCEHAIQKGASGWKRLAIRCIVAEKIKHIIAQHKIKNFVVADKWLYPLPASKNRRAQPVVLMVKDMNIYNRTQTKEAWIKKPNRTTVKELYTILSHGYGSAFLRGNIPYTKSGKFAFIDTEYDKRPINMNHARQGLRPQMQHYWDHLTKRK